MDNNKLIAHLLIYNWGSRKNYVKITTLAVDERFRNKQLASRLLQFMLREMKESGMHEFRGETRISNYAMQKTFEKFGFNRTEIMKDYYDDPKEDAYKYILND